ncbi:phytanoyl-CoA dioxygenase family protein [Zobellia galactanivorans]|uniref:phytanoyl-CoA dioxygenase family protein n=1 Tax=Zobellia galactanivorans (strain DSM 12802 / CCUG 47099 / CIP 106680 / NCIMB 13871 / Dsij) TaxID=63186 RepID=UPI001C06CD84|nr:phytanoyl-CoA dioxygenase family protein [Zobellia galactanivorans]MBU3025265.1 phytanoyl-CoA dioxygenase family protein [Zobellia galactanivorans]
MKRVDDLDDKNLQKKLRNDFLADGFIFFPGFLNALEISEVTERLNAFKKSQIEHMPRSDVYYEDINDKTSLKQLQRLFKYDSFFADMMDSSRFEKLASILLDDGVVGKNIQYFNKPPKIGQPTPAHQDGYYFMLEPNEAVTMWMALEPVDEENGCVRYIKGSHLTGMREHGKTGTLGFSQGIVDYGGKETDENEVFYPTQAGDLLVHHSMTIHRADGNSSENRTRQAMGFIYYANKAKEDYEAQKAYQKKLAEDLTKENKV